MIRSSPTNPTSTWALTFDSTSRTCLHLKVNSLYLIEIFCGKKCQVTVKCPDFARLPVCTVTVVQKTGPLHYCNKLLKQIIACSAIQSENATEDMLHPTLAVVCKLLDLGHAGLGHAELGQWDWDMRNWDSGTGTCGTGTAGLGQALQGQFDCFFIFL